MTALVGIDCGQTGSRARLVVDGRTLCESEHDPVYTHGSLEPQLARIIDGAVAGLGASDRTADADVPDLTVAVGSSGLSEEISADLVLSLVVSPAVTGLILAHDSVTSYLGALGPEPGAVVAAGTGVVTLAVGSRKVARVDGWGYLFGDAGSGYWIGRRAIEAVLRAYDGRGPATDLTDRVTAEFPHLPKLYLEVQADPQKVSRVARYARDVAELAGSDPVATAISHDAGRALAESVATGLRMVDADPDAPVARIGNVFRSEVLRETFDESLRSAVPDAVLVENPGAGLDGAVTLAGLPEGSPLAASVTAARR
ncbi:N-acetylglucosamine kinase [Acidipropionibacterium virtanenii]|uniref:N-acetylmuramic acid/N-acetylglucosamine kinase n=1 Tax=Acidipropionibacterium virtanenii TaxID=2057246 RepID=A0A344UPK9_9ACTN|nr:BadF/BadG/BcrA/BcrD ATPase family protein [Acidipropionibacterium virtanenii]AXE37207.1 N-acetylmuramic acid/N-acetylglucosamine kinase [Acidipropionibacterium virtanenii]